MTSAPHTGEHRPLVFDLRYSADTIRDISDRYLDALPAERFRRETVILKREPSGAAAPPIPADAVHWLDLDRAALQGNRRGAIERFVALCQERRPDLVIAHRFKAVAVMARARPQCEFCGFGVIHGTHQFDRLSRRLFARRHLQDPLHLIGVSEAVTADLRRVCGHRKRNLHILSNCIDDERVRRELIERPAARELLGLPLDAPVVGSVARLVPVKDQHTLLDAFARLAEAVPKTHLCLIGDGPARPELERHAQRLGLGDRICFAGWRENAYRLLGAFDLFALTSVREGFGLALAEAMAAGVPVVATDTGGVREVTGDLAPLARPGDAPAIARALTALLVLSEGERDRLSRQLRQRVAERFSPRVFAERLNRLLIESGAGHRTGD